MVSKEFDVVSKTASDRPGSSLAVALESLVARGTITPDQRDAILAEVAQAKRVTTTPEPSGRRRRSLTDVLVEVGAYVGSALVLAALFAIIAQSWDDLSRALQAGILLGIALVTAPAGWAVSRDAAAGSARRRLAGVLLSGAAAASGGAVAIALGPQQRDDGWVGVVALSVAVVILVFAQLVAASAVTEIALFGTTFALLVTAGEWVRPPGTIRVDEYGFEYTDTSTYDAVLQVAGVTFGLAWAAVVARRLMHRELAVALGSTVALICAMALAGSDRTRPIGLVMLAVLAAVGFWRFLAEGGWPWLASAILSVTAFVFWLVGVNQRPAVAFLVAGLVLLGSSAVGWQVAQRRRRPPPEDSPPAASE